MRSPSGEGRSLPPSKMALKSYKDSVEHPLIMTFRSSMTFKMFRRKKKLTVWFLEYQSPARTVNSPAGVGKGIGIIERL